VAATGCVSKTFGTSLPLVLGNLGLQVPLKASLDDFRIYGVVLSASEVAALAKL